MQTDSQEGINTHDAVVAEDLLRWKADLDKFPEYKARVEHKAKDRLAKQQEEATKKQILKAAKKRPTRPGKLGLPKLKPIVKEGKLTRSGRKAAETEDSDLKKNRAAKRPRRKVWPSPRLVCTMLASEDLVTH